MKVDHRLLSLLSDLRLSDRLLPRWQTGTATVQEVLLLDYPGKVYISSAVDPETIFSAFFESKHFADFFVIVNLNLQRCETKAGHRLPHWIHSSNFKSHTPAIQLNALRTIRLQQKQGSTTDR